MATHEIDNSARRQEPPREDASEEEEQPNLKKLFYNSTTVSLSSHRSMMARAMMHHVLTSGEGVSGVSSTHRSNQEEDDVTSDGGLAPLLPSEQELLHPFDDSRVTPPYDPFCCPLVEFELLNLREYIDSELEVLGRERVSRTTDEEDDETEGTEDSIVIRRRQLLRQ